MEEQKIVGLIVVCTGRYGIFLQPLVDSIEKWFFCGLPIDIYLLSDVDYKISASNRISMKHFFVPSMKFPFPTLFRYKWITKYAQDITSANVFYIDVDMLFVNIVDEEILPTNGELVAVFHPGFYSSKGWGDHGTHHLSTAFVAPSERHDYYCGGFQGGGRDAYIEASALMDKNIDADMDMAENIGYKHNGGILAKWNDESHWNKYLKTHPFKSLSPEYCMVEEVELRHKWGIDNLTPRLLALKKDHDKIRL